MEKSSVVNVETHNRLVLEVWTKEIVMIKRMRVNKLTIDQTFKGERISFVEFFIKYSIVQLKESK
jgi:hypothetical protein